MPSTRGSKKRPNDLDTKSETNGTQPSKKRATTSKSGALTHSGNNGRENVQVINVDIDAIPKELLPRDYIDVPHCRFQKGNTYIQLVPYDGRYNFYVEKDLLLRVFPYLAGILCHPFDEVDEDMANKIKTEFDVETFLKLGYLPNKQTWVLCKAAFTEEKPAAKVKPQTAECLHSPKALNQLEAQSLRPPPETNPLHPARKPLRQPVLATTEQLSVISGVTVVESPHSHKPQKLHAFITAEQISAAFGGAIITSGPIRNSPIRIPSPPASPKDEGDDTIMAYINTSAAISLIPEGQHVEYKSTIKEDAEDSITHDTAASTGTNLIPENEQVVESRLKIREEDEDSTMAIKGLISGVVDTAVESAMVPTTPNVDISLVLGKEKDADPQPAIKNETEDSVIATTIASAEVNLDLEMEKPDDITFRSAIKEVEEIAIITTTTNTNSSRIPEKEVDPSTKQGWATPTISDNEKSHRTTNARLIRYAHGEKLPHSPIELEESNSETKTINGIPRYICNAYRNLFLFIHDKIPEIDSEDIGNALSQVEALSKIAHVSADSFLLRLRPYLSNHLLQFGSGLFRAILQEPPRWLLLSLQLQCPLIFKEAVIHLVGRYPHYPWSTPASKLPQPVNELIVKKVEELRALKTSVDHKLLFNNSITIDDKALSIAELEKSNFDTWFIVQLWRDWYCTSVGKNDPLTLDGAGVTYRLIAKGGGAYLDTLTVYLKMIEFKSKDFGSWNPRGVEEDMTIMKGYAQETVKALVVNQSTLDIEESGIKYLTCIKVENDELPWIKKDGA